jgi:hypothetical protein
VAATLARGVPQLTIASAIGVTIESAGQDSHCGHRRHQFKPRHAVRVEGDTG